MGKRNKKDSPPTSMGMQLSIASSCSLASLAPVPAKRTTASAFPALKLTLKPYRFTASASTTAPAAVFRTMCGASSTKGVQSSSAQRESTISNAWPSASALR